MGQSGVAVFGFVDSGDLGLYVNGEGLVTAKYTYALNTWHYVSAVVDGSAPSGQNLKIYIDGVLAVQGGTPVSSGFGTSGNTFQLAGDGLWRGWAGNANDGSWYVGQIDEVAIWSSNSGGGSIASGGTP